MLVVAAAVAGAGTKAEVAAPFCDSDPISVWWLLWTGRWDAGRAVRVGGADASLLVSCVGYAILLASDTKKQ